MADKSDIKVEFAPGCFDDWDGTQEELDQLMAEIKRMAQTGELEKNSLSLEEILDELDEEQTSELERMLESRDSTGPRKLQ